MRSKLPEPKSMITYLHTIYKVLVADKAEEAKAENGDKDSEQNEENDEKWTVWHKMWQNNK